MENQEITAQSPEQGQNAVETPNTTSEPAAAPQTPDMHGFTSEDLAGMRKFIDNNGGWDAIKSKISNPVKPQEPVQPPVDNRAPWEKPVDPVQPVEQPQYRTPEGSITAQEFLAQQYFQALSGEEKYAGIADKIASGDVLKEMASFNIQALNQDGSINDGMVRRYLDLKAQTVPAKSTNSEPNASTAPTVEYIPVGDKITDINQAYEVLAQDAKLKRAGQPGHPQISLAEAFIKENLGKK